MKKISVCKIYGIIGFPVQHSLSPYMQNAAFKKLNIDAVYLTFPVRRNKLKEVMACLKKSSISGFNVTIPFKTECMRYLDRVYRTAKAIDAVNTVVNRNNRLTGYNTDSDGFIRSLKEDLNFNPKAKSIFLLGAGGAARAVAFGLAKKEACGIYIYDIDKSKQRSLAANLKKHFKGCKVKGCRKDEVASSIGNCSLLVNCTPLGMKRKDPLPIDVKFLHRGLKVYDVVYTPLKTELVRQAIRKGIRATGGLGMLVYQGGYSFKLWTKREAPIKVMRRELLKRLAQ